MSDSSPRTIPELWHILDKRLALIEAAQADHKEDHAAIEKRLDDHETRIRSGLATASLLTGAGGLFSLIAIVRSFMP